MDTTITIRVDSETKKNAKNVLDNLGLDLSSAINIYLKQIIKKQAIPFSIDNTQVEPKEIVVDEDHRDAHKDDELFESIRDEMNGVG